MEVKTSSRKFIGNIAGGLAALCTCAWLTLAQDSSPLTSNLASGIQSLKLGQYLWAPMVSLSGPILAVINLHSQRIYVYRNGVLIGVATISTGKPGHGTPTGVFTVLQKQVHHKSNLYDSGSMSYMQRLTWSEVAIHAGNLPGYPASHGCIRIPIAFTMLVRDYRTRDDRRDHGPGCRTASRTHP